jgi:hypothetical protein
MSNIWLLRLIPAVIFIVTALILYIQFPDRWITDSAFTATGLIFSFSAAYLVFIPIIAVRKGESDAPQIGSIGIDAFFSLAIFGISSIALYQAYLNNTELALAFTAAAMAAFMLMLLVTKLTVRFLTDVSQKTDFKSSQTHWGAGLQQISNECDDANLKLELNKLADDTKYLSRDISREGTVINQKITTALTVLSKFISENNYESAKKVIHEISQLIKIRESELGSSRSKV